MYSLTGRSSPHSRNQPFPLDLFLLAEFKAYVNGLVSHLGIDQRFRPRLYTYADYVMVKLYALVWGHSTEAAAEKLNTKIATHYRKKLKLRLRLYQDGLRRRRLVPHQTDVDKFFRLLSENEVHYIFGNTIMNLVMKIRERSFQHGRMRFLVDNTEYGYYGKPLPPFDVGTLKKPGTKVCRMFQGHAVNGQGLTLYTGFYSIKKGYYRSQSIPGSVDWHRFCNLNLSYALADREFYRVALVKDLKNRHLPILMPAKQYPGVREGIRRYLLYDHPLVSQYLFSQTYRRERSQHQAYVWQVIVGKYDQSAPVIRQRFLRGHLTLDQATHQLSAFFTTLTPWRNKHRWARWLMRAYKKRWNIETGFAKMNEIHSSFRNRYPAVQLAQLYLRGIIYNNWQLWKHQRERQKIRPSRNSLDMYLLTLKHEIRTMIKTNVRENLNYMQERKRRLYFED